MYRPDGVDCLPQSILLGGKYLSPMDLQPEKWNKLWVFVSGKELHDNRFVTAYCDREGCGNGAAFVAYKLGASAACGRNAEW